MWRSGALTMTSLVLPEQLTWDTYEAIGAWLGTVKRSSSWWLGDWLAYGERTFQERAAQAHASTGLAEQTLLNLATISRRVPPAVRREGVPVHLHAELTSLPPVEQDRWLARIEREGWTRATLRERMQEEGRGALPPAGEEYPPLDAGGPSPALEDVARSVVHAAKSYGADYLIPRHAFAQLCAALGEEL
jgi:hypothetical protein